MIEGVDMPNSPTATTNPNGIQMMASGDVFIQMSGDMANPNATKEVNSSVSLWQKEIADEIADKERRRKRIQAVIDSSAEYKRQNNPAIFRIGGGVHSIPTGGFPTGGYGRSRVQPTTTSPYQKYHDEYWNQRGIQPGDANHPVSPTYRTPNASWQEKMRARHEDELMARTPGDIIRREQAEQKRQREIMERQRAGLDAQRDPLTPSGYRKPGHAGWQSGGGSWSDKMRRARPEGYGDGGWWDAAKVIGGVGMGPLGFVVKEIVKPHIGKYPAGALGAGIGLIP